MKDKCQVCNYYRWLTKKRKTTPWRWCSVRRDNVCNYINACYSCWRSIKKLCNGRDISLYQASVAEVTLMKGDGFHFNALDEKELNRFLTMIRKDIKYNPE